MSACTILILTYKGKFHLEFLLPTVRTAIANYKGSTSIDVLIVDNGQDDVTRQYVRDNFPDYKYEFSPVNDYLFSLNRYVAEMRSDYFLLLNDDIKLHPDVLNALIPSIDADSTLFGVTCKIYAWDGEYVASAVRMAYYRLGWLHSWFREQADDRIRYTLYAAGGAAIFRKDFFNELKGFDELYRPAYCEDADLGIRAWQNGWKVIYHPGAVLYHREGGTIKDQFKKDKLEQATYKNQILLMVKNMRSPGFLLVFFLLLPYRILVNRANNKNQYKALLQSLSNMPQALKRRRKIRTLVPDKNWLAELNKEYLKSN